ncbi:MAG: CRISPR-associated endonuclease Cas1 [Acidobacteria bacterium]|nr:CRISPR-associated endonuclease Cas1 [Acidobacteriota bacterium]MDW7983587.1 CRISPR-associated endonuclease Cas1 [Acidobacteriota bacterium]
MCSSTARACSTWPGRPSLALDLMEEFRPIVADSVVLWLVNNRVVSSDDFVRRGPACALKDPTRRRVIKAYEARMDTRVRHPLFGYQASYRRILEIQAR